MHQLRDFIETLGLTHPLTFLALFLGASLLMVWRLEAMMKHGLEGTALGTLVMPYCSGLGNLVFVYLVLRDDLAPREVLVNALVNNVTNLTLLLGLPALLWSLDILPARQAAAASGKAARPAKRRNADDTAHRISRLSLLLTLAAVLFFTGAAWALGGDGSLGRADGLALVGLFLFWQCVQVFDVLKHNVRTKTAFSALFYVDLVLLLAGAWVLYESLDWIVLWLMSGAGGGVLRAEHLGWLSGWLLVLPNAVLALYYAWRGRADVVYSSQVGDGHICIPLCLGLCALARPVPLSPLFETGVYLLLGAVVVHAFFITLFGRLPRWAGGALVAAYGWFVYAGLIA
ncbi:MAG TPA: sodium:calcium symporter [Opitutaceae bacterium]